MAVAALAAPVIQGLNDSMELRFLQTSVARRSKDHRSTSLNQGRVLQLFYFIPVAALLVKCDSLLALLGQDSKAVAQTQRYLYFNFLAIFLGG